MADTLSVGQTFTYNGVNYVLTDISKLHDSPNSEAARLGGRELILLLKLPGAGPQPGDYRNPNLHNQGGKVGTV